MVPRKQNHFLFTFLDDKLDCSHSIMLIEYEYRLTLQKNIVSFIMSFTPVVFPCIACLVIHINIM